MKKIFLIFVVILVSLTVKAQELTKKEWAIALHGGAGYYPQDAPPEEVAQYMQSLEEALNIATNILEVGGSAMDAVEATIKYLEDNELFNAGRGAVYTAEGKNELDAAFMHGNTLNAGAITGVTTVKNPISLARYVMEQSKHVLFAGEGAEVFADEAGVERVNPLYFRVEETYEKWKKNNAGQGYLNQSMENNGWKMGTVGAVALDKKGNLVAGTSTGGMSNKRYGRVGDVPIIGSGTYANDLVAVSASGWGERIMLNVSAHALAAHLKYTESTLETSMKHLVDEILNPKEAGFIAVDKYGNISMRTNTDSMHRAASNSEGYRVVKIWKD